MMDNRWKQPFINKYGMKAFLQAEHRFAVIEDIKVRMRVSVELGEPVDQEIQPLDRK